MSSLIETYRKYTRNRKDKRWTFEGIIDRLKSIRKVENLINGTVIKTNISTLDEEQQQILKLLEVKLV